MTAQEKITLKDVYAVVNRLEDKMDENLKSLNGRVDEIEHKQARTSGYSAAIGAITGAAISLIGSWIAGGGLHK